MSQAHAHVPVSLMSLLGVPEVSEIVEVMKARQPPEGLVGAYISSRFRLGRGARESLDARIFRAAATSLDQDMAGPLAFVFSQRQELRGVAAASIRDGQHDRN